MRNHLTALSKGLAAATLEQVTGLDARLLSVMVGRKPSAQGG